MIYDYSESRTKQKPPPPLVDEDQRFLKYLNDRLRDERAATKREDKATLKWLRVRLGLYTPPAAKPEATEADWKLSDYLHQKTSQYLDSPEAGQRYKTTKSRARDMAKLRAKWPDSLIHDVIDWLALPKNNPGLKNFYWAHSCLVPNSLYKNFPQLEAKMTGDKNFTRRSGRTEAKKNPRECAKTDCVGWKGSSSDYCWDHRNT